MSELAFGANGERFAPPATAAFWRVRRLRPGGRGVPEVVFAESGLPLIVPMESGIDEFRQLVDNAPGKYRLDPIDDTHEVCEDSSAAYICITERKPKPATAHTKEEHSSASDSLILELVRANAEMVKTMTDRFAGVMESAATLLRAADGAGLPQRKPVPPPIQIAQAWRNATPAAADDDYEEAEDSSQIASVLQTVAEKAMPLLSHTINTKVLGLTPEQSIALMGGGVMPAHQPAAPAAAPSPDAEEEEAPAPVDFMAHLMAIEQLLSAEEAQLARHAIGQMEPATLAAWRERILTMTPEQAAMTVRAEIARLMNHQPDDSANAQKDAA